MSVAVDTNILVYAHRPEAPEHDAARRALERLRHGSRPWAIPWTVAYEFLSVVSQPRIWLVPTPLSQAVAALAAWSAPGQARILGEGPAHLEHLTQITGELALTGSRVFDARVAATCLEHGVTELWSADRDFSRFPALKVVNPLVG